MFEFLRKIWLKNLFLEDLVWIPVFLKNFLSHTHVFHSWNTVLWGVFALNCFVFQKFEFSRFLIDRIYLSIDWKCDKNLGYNLPGSIGARLIEFNFRSIEANFQPIENWSMSVLKGTFLTCSSFYLNFSNTLFTISPRPIQSKSFCCVLPQIFKGFCSQV